MINYLVIVVVAQEVFVYARVYLSTCPPRVRLDTETRRAPAFHASLIRIKYINMIKYLLTIILFMEAVRKHKNYMNLM